MIIDRLSTNRMGKLPDFLKIQSPLTKKLLNSLEDDEKTRKANGIKRSISLLSSMDKYVYVDYDKCNPVTKEYSVYEKDI